MNNRRPVTEEDLLITEVLIAKSYGRLKRSVIQVPSRAYQSLGETAREHPYATAGTAVVAGAAMYGIIKMMTSHTSGSEAQARSRAPVQKETCHPDHMHDMLLMIIPLVTPYIASYLQKYLEKIPEKRY